MFFQPGGSHSQKVNPRPGTEALLLTLPCSSIILYLSGLLCLLLVFLLSPSHVLFMTLSRVLAFGCCRCRLSDSVSVCLIFCISYKGLWGLSSWRLFTSLLWRLSLRYHFVCHPGVTTSLSVPVSSLSESRCFCPLLFLSFRPLNFSDFLVERDNDYCVCETPCNLTRYGKEMSFVKIPSKASAKYLAKKFNKTEQYIA